MHLDRINSLWSILKLSHCQLFMLRVLSMKQDTSTSYTSLLYCHSLSFTLTLLHLLLSNKCSFWLYHHFRSVIVLPHTCVIFLFNVWNVLYNLLWCLVPYKSMYIRAQSRLMMYVIFILKSVFHLVTKYNYKQELQQVKSSYYKWWNLTDTV